MLIGSARKQTNDCVIQSTFETCERLIGCDCATQVRWKSGSELCILWRLSGDGRDLLCLLATSAIIKPLLRLAKSASADSASRRLESLKSGRRGEKRGSSFSGFCFPSVCPSVRPSARLSGLFFYPASFLRENMSIRQKCHLLAH